MKQLLLAVAILAACFVGDAHAEDHVTITGPATVAPGDMFQLTSDVEILGSKPFLLEWSLVNSEKGIFPVENNTKCMAAFGTPGQYKFRLTAKAVKWKDAAAEKKKDLSPDSVTFVELVKDVVVTVTGSDPKPPGPKPPGPGPKPDDVPFTNDLTIVMVRESGDNLSDDAEACLFGEGRRYSRAEAGTNFRILDPQQDVSAAPQWATYLNAKRESLPWLFVVDKDSSYSGPLTTVEDLKQREEEVKK